VKHFHTTHLDPTQPPFSGLRTPTSPLAGCMRPSTECFASPGPPLWGHLFPHYSSVLFPPSQHKKLLILMEVCKQRWVCCYFFVLPTISMFTLHWLIWMKISVTGLANLLRSHSRVQTFVSLPVKENGFCLQKGPISKVPWKGVVNV
jgi:hypothetical protein